MTTSTIEPIRIVLPDAVGGYFRFSDLPRLISKALYPDTKEADADPQGDYYMIRAFEQMRLETDLAQAAALSRGELGYLHVVENSKLKRPLEYRSAGPLSRGIVHLDWLNDWGRANNPAYVFSVAAARKPQADTPIYHFPMFERLEPRTPWAGGRMVDTDVLTLAEAATMATKHAGAPVNIGDFLRAAGRGEITLRAIVHRTAKVQKHDGGIYCNGGQENENKVPAGAIATLPLTACQHLAAVGRASWRTFDGFERVEGVLQRYTKGQLVVGEPDFETVPDDCRVVGYDVRALADAFIDLEPDTAQAAPEQSAATPEPTEPDWAMLATPEQLITAFGTFTGMNKEWFSNLSDKPALMNARFRPGQGGRKRIAPLFYVYPVLEWLIDERRKVGTPMKKATGWRMLKLHFQEVHEAYEMNAPDPD